MQLLKDIGITSSVSEISNVHMKLKHAVPPVLPPMDRRKDFFVMPVPRTCSDCNVLLQLSPMWTGRRAFKFHVGFIEVHFKEASCPDCSRVYSNVWNLPKSDVHKCRLKVFRGDEEQFQIIGAPKIVGEWRSATEPKDTFIGSSQR